MPKIELKREVLICDVQGILTNPIEEYYNRHEDAYHCYGRAIDPYTKQESFIIGDYE